MSRRHTVDIPDIIWAYAQQKSGKTVPASWIREHWILPAWIADVHGSPQHETPVVEEDRWAEIGMDTNPMDDEFTEARNKFVAQMGSEDKAIKWFQDGAQRGIRDPRAWLMSWWHKQKPQAI